MAGLHFHFWFRDINTYHSGNWKTIAAIKAPTNTPVRIYDFTLTMRGITAANPHVEAALVLVTNASASAGSGGAVDQAATFNDGSDRAGVRRADPSRAEAIQSLFSYGPNGDAAWSIDFTADTTRDAFIVGSRLTHEQSSWSYVHTAPYALLIPGGTYAALRVNNPNGSTGVLCAGWINGEE